MDGVHVDVYTDQKSFEYVFTQKELNIKQRKWLEFIRYYDMSVLYHPGEDNVAADAVSHMTMGSVSYVFESKKPSERCSYVNSFGC